MGESKNNGGSKTKGVKKGKQNKGAQTMVRERRMCETKGVMKQEGSKCEAGECGGMVREWGMAREGGEVRIKRGEARTKRGEARTKRESREWVDNEMGRR